MGKYRITNPQHPMHRARLVHAALLENHGVGFMVARAEWKRAIILASGVTTDASIAGYTRLMASLGMIINHGRKGIELCGSQEHQFVAPAVQEEAASSS